MKEKAEKDQEIKMLKENIKKLENNPKTIVNVDKEKD